MQYPQSGLFYHGGRRLALPAFILMLLAFSGCQKIELERAGGTPTNWDKYRGQWVLVNYWAEWCKPCLEEIPELNELDKAPDIAVLGVNFDGISGEPLVKLGERMGIEFTMLGADPGPDFGWQAPMALPATFVVDPEGTLIEARFGPQTEEDIRALIGE
ncbi:TlpA family protein disulfide reductase [Marinobacter sp. VGCF2001]|uniref:TlpA family protein disulfide reductase n=1 Tax=Marinobacter sp. VGCF2001 TaxID=3417189 RepID=UPI003CF9C8A8